VAPPDSSVSCRLDAEWQPEDLDEPDGRGVIEGVTLVVGREVLVVERQR
jgi:hypothetical protein